MIELLAFVMRLMLTMCVLLDAKNGHLWKVPERVALHKPNYSTNEDDDGSAT